MKHLFVLLLSCACAAFAVAQPTISHTRPALPADSTAICVPYRLGWNMVSNPVIRPPGTDSIWQVFCGHGTCFQGWPGGGYHQQCTALNGMGLWIKVTGYPTTCCIDGGAITRDSIPVFAGWNLIGSISHPVAVSSITTAPPDIRVSEFFGYTSRYAKADTIQPGQGYWVKVAQAGRLVLTSE